MSRAGAVVYLIARCDKLVRQHDGAETDQEKKAMWEQIVSMRRLILDLRAGRVDAFDGYGLTVVVKD